MSDVILKPEEEAAVYQIVCDFTVRRKMGDVAGVAFQILLTEPEYQPIPCAPILKILAFSEREAQSAAIELAVRCVHPDFTIINRGAVTASTVERITGIHGIAESVVSGRTE